MIFELVNFKGEIINNLDCWRRMEKQYLALFRSIKSVSV